MLNKLKNFIKSFYKKRGTNFKEKFVVIESDDWGSFRSTKEGLNALKENFSIEELDSYQKYDCLESVDDLGALYEILSKHKDSTGRSPIITANYIMRNVKSFDKNTQNFEYEHFLDSYANKNLMKKEIEEGIKSGVWYPQLHGLIHFNSSLLKKEIQQDKKVELALKNKMIGICSGNFKGMDTFADEEAENTNLKLASKIFEDTFGYKSLSYVFPCYTWTKDKEKELDESGIKVIQTSMFQFIPNKNKTKIKMHYIAEKNKLKQKFFVRNCQFEPSKYGQSHDSLIKCKNDCLKEIEQAFKNKKPAIICSHRCNYVGGIDTNNRELNLKLLDSLLSDIIKKYPDVKFVTSVELYKKLENK